MTNKVNDYVLSYNNNSVISCLIDNDMKIKLLVDTGASLCVIKYEWLRNYPDLVNKIISDRITIKGISGNLVSLGYIYLDLYFDGQAFNQKYYIFENISCSADGILGQEFFLKYNAVLNYKDCT